MSPADVAMGGTGAAMVSTLVPGASWFGLGAAALAATGVVLAQWVRLAAVLAVQVVAVGLAVEQAPPGLAALAGLAATVFLLLAYVRANSDLLAAVLQRLLPVVAVLTVAALGATLLPMGPGWLAALAPLAVAVLYAIAVLSYARRSRPREHSLVPYNH